MEVKASQNAITLRTNNWQIAAEIAMAADAFPTDYYVRAWRGETPIKSAGHPNYKAAAYTLVLPFGATVGPDVVAECTRLNVNFYISYAYIGQNDEVVFSNPIRQNNLTLEEGTSPGKLNRGAIFNFDKATVYWRDSNKLPKLKDDTNNDIQNHSNPDDFE